jgi:hypothetical protein
MQKILQSQVISLTEWMWNGNPVTLSGRYRLLPDKEVRHLHRRVIATAKDDRHKIPFHGRVAGEALYHRERIYLVETEHGTIERCRKVQVIEWKG